MIRIETTAEFDENGGFTITGRTTAPISPGQHPIAIEIGETPVTSPAVLATESIFVERDGLLLLNAKPTPGTLIDIVQLIDRQREERERELLGGCSE